MTKDETNILTLNKYYQIFSADTKRLYMDKQYRCYLFQSDLEAKQFCDQLQDVYFNVNSPSYIKQGPFISLCYGLGIDQIRVKTAKNEKYVDISVNKKDAKRQFYNRSTVRNVLRLKQTRKNKYLKELAETLFISPILIDKRETGQYPVIHYAYGMLKDGSINYLLFTTLQEFEKWNDTQKQDFSPNQTSLQELNKIRNGNPVLINPLSDQLIITDKQIVSITRTEQT